jgi:hypothetical protein
MQVNVNAADVAVKGREVGSIRCCHRRPVPVLAGVGFGRSAVTRRSCRRGTVAGFQAADPGTPVLATAAAGRKFGDKVARC